MPQVSVLGVGSPGWHVFSPGAPEMPHTYAFPGGNFNRHPAIPRQTNHLKFYLDRYGTPVAIYVLIVRGQVRRTVWQSTTPLPHYPPGPFPLTNSFPHNLSSDPHPLNPVLSIFYKNIGGQEATPYLEPAILASSTHPFFFYILRAPLNNVLSATPLASIRCGLFPSRRGGVPCGYSQGLP
jgi:hypothetical protein